MTSAQLLRAVVRRWYVVLVGLLAIAATCAVEARAQGVFWTQVDVVFLVPASTHAPNTLEATSQSLISTAGIVAIRVNDGQRETALSSSSVSLVGEGIYDGRSVRLPNSGGQWVDNFTRPVLDVQVSGPTHDGVVAELEATLADIQRELDVLQIQGGADQYNRISTQLAPTSAVIYLIAPQVRRAMAVTAILGSLLTLLTVAVVDRQLLRRRAPRPATAHLLVPEPS